jgi:hypothetical protein
VEKEQRGEPLLPIERLKRSFEYLTVHKVEIYSVTANDSTMKHVQEARSNAFDLSAIAPLRVIALKKRDLDPIDRRRVWNTLHE